MKRTRPVSVFALAAASFLAAGCSRNESPGPGSAGAAGSASGSLTAAAAPITITLLETADENGYLAPTKDDGPARGGAAQLFAAWLANEKHCVPSASAKCESAKTIALTGGDHWNGSAISSYFQGKSTADVLALLGYSASALGNNDLDYGREAFLANAKLAGIPYVAANLKAKSAEAGLGAKDSVVVERAGVRVAVVGLASLTSGATAMEGRFDGLAFDGYEESLARAVPAAWKEGVDAVVVLAHECPTELKSLVGKHEDWKISAVLGAHCKEPLNDKAGSTVFAAPGKHFEHYARVSLTIDKSKPVGSRVTAVDGKTVDVSGEAAGDPAVVATIKKWQDQLDTALGEEVGFAKKGFAKDSPEIARWVTGAVREEVKADVAILNRKGLRAGLPAGAVKRSSIYSVLPFDNSVMLVNLTGEQLAKELENGEAIYSGVTKAGKDWKDATGKALDPKKSYVVATVEYLYFGGSGFHFEAADPMPRESGMVWQTPVIDWTKKQGTSEKKPLETVLPKG